jgi:sialic acid synthase SpsE
MAAAAMGACVIEKHFTLDRTLPGPDHRASLEPGQLAELVQGAAQVYASLGDGVKMVSAEERTTASLVRRSLAAAVPIARGQRITRDMLMTLRPAQGIAPADVHQVAGRIATRNLSRYDVLTWSDVQAAESVA